MFLEGKAYSAGFVVVSWFNVPVNSYGHVEAVS